MMPLYFPCTFLSVHMFVTFTCSYVQVIISFLSFFLNALHFSLSLESLKSMITFALMKLSYQNFHIHASTLKLCKFIFPSVLLRLSLIPTFYAAKAKAVLWQKYYISLVWCWFTLALKLPWAGWMGFSWELCVPQNAVYMFTSCSDQVHNGYLLCSQFVPQESDELTDKTFESLEVTFNGRL